MHVSCEFLESDSSCFSMLDKPHVKETHTHTHTHTHRCLKTRNYPVDPMKRFRSTLTWTQVPWFFDLIWFDLIHFLCWFTKRELLVYEWTPLMSFSQENTWELNDSVPDLNIVFRDRAPMVQRTLLNLLRLLLLLGPKPERRRALLFSSGFFFFFYFLSTIRAFLGGLTWSKTLENLHTHWNPRQLGRRWGWDPGVAQRLYSAPWNTIRKLDE